MISGFGIDHGEVSKSLSDKNAMALYRAARKGAGRNKQYALSRLHLSGIGQNAVRKPMVVQQQKKLMSDATRTDFGTRTVNRARVL